MKKIVYLIVFLTLVKSQVCYSQSGKIYDSLCSAVERARPATQRIMAFHMLSNYLYRNQFIFKADSVRRLQIIIAELLDSKDLLLKTYFDNAAANIVDWSSSNDFDLVVSFLEKGLKEAKRLNDKNHIVIAYTRLASVLRKRGKYQESLENLSNAQLISRDASDSIQATVNIEAGNYYMAKEQYNVAGPYFNNAYEIAIKTRNSFLETESYRALVSLNSAAGNESTAKDFLLKSVQLDKQFNNREGLVKDYMKLARFQGENEYIKMAIALADSLGLDWLRIAAKEIRLSIFMNTGTPSSQMLSYLESNPDLKQYFQRGSGENYPYELGYIYLYGGQPDSALYYFGSVKDNMLKNYDLKVGSMIYLDIGDCYYAKKDIAKAIESYLKALSYYQKSEEGTRVAEIYLWLSKFHSERGDFKTALDYSRLRSHIIDSLYYESQSRDAGFVTTDVKNKLKVGEYISLTLASVVVFVSLLLLGIIPISRVAFRILGYFLFISLFEFFILLLDANVVNSLTYDSSLKLWLAKIALVLALVVLQRLFGHRIVRFIESRQNSKVKRRLSLMGLWAKKKPRPGTADSNEKEIKEDTTVS